MGLAHCEVVDIVSPAGVAQNFFKGFWSVYRGLSAAAVTLLLFF